MTEHTDDLAEALNALRGEVRDAIAVPDPVNLRARANHQLRVRRAVTAVAAVAAVLAVALGGGTMLRTDTAPPPLIDTPAPAQVTPSPRPEPITPEPLDDPITEVDWRTATITVPARDGCPDGPVTFVPVSDIHQNAIGPAESYPKLRLNASNAGYGDLTGDGRAEAVVAVSCVASAEEEATDGNGSQLLVVTREEDGSLVGLGWAPPVDPGNYWIAASGLVVEAVPAFATEWPFDSIPAGLAVVYAWDGQAFVEQGQAIGYPAIVPLDLAEPGPTVRPRAAVATGLGCPDQVVRFANSIDVLEAPWLASTDNHAMYGLPPQDGPYLFDLDGTGMRLLVVGLSCLQRDGTSTDGLAVFERAGDRWQGISVLLSPIGQPPVRWSADGDRFMIEWAEGVQEAYRWSGTELIPVDD